jgi:hypothetical protein
MEFAKNHAITKGPIYLDIETYRYHGNFSLFLIFFE